MSIDRRRYLGGSDAAAIVGLDRWRSAHDVYLEKIGDPVPDRYNERMHWGVLLEREIRAEYRRLTGRRVRPAALRDPDHPFLRGHVDGFGDALLEIKTAQDGRPWADVDPETRIGPSAITSIPPYYRPQLVHYMNCGVIDRADVAVLIQGHDFRMYLDIPIPPWAGAMRAELVRFWTEHVQLRVPPPVDGSDGAGRLLAAQYPVDSGAELVALAHHYPILDALRRARTNVEQAGAEKARLEQLIKQAMGEASYLLAPGVRISWKRTRDSEQVDWQRYSEHLEGLLKPIGGSFGGSVGEVLASAEKLRGVDLDTIRGIYTNRVPGSRRFVAKFADPDDAGGVASPVQVDGLTVDVIEGSNRAHD